MCVVVFFSLEVPLSRLCYQARICQEVTPRKLELMEKHADLLDCTGGCVRSGAAGLACVRF